MPILQGELHGGCGAVWRAWIDRGVRARRTATLSGAGRLMAAGRPHFNQSVRWLRADRDERSLSDPVRLRIRESRTGDAMRKLILLACACLVTTIAAVAAEQPQERVRLWLAPSSADVRQNPLLNR